MSKPEIQMHKVMNAGSPVFKRNVKADDLVCGFWIFVGVIAVIAFFGLLGG